MSEEASGAAANTAGDGSSTGGPVRRLLMVLEQQADLLDDLHHRVEVVSLLVASGQQRFVQRATDELDDVADRLAAIEVTRQSAAVAAARVLGLDARDLHLRGIAAAMAPAEAASLTLLGDRMRRTAAAIADELIPSLERASIGLGRIRGALEGFATGSSAVLYGSNPSTPPPTSFDERA